MRRFGRSAKPGASQWQLVREVGRAAEAHGFDVVQALFAAGEGVCVTGQAAHWWGDPGTVGHPAEGLKRVLESARDEGDLALAGRVAFHLGHQMARAVQSKSRRAERAQSDV